MCAGTTVSLSFHQVLGILCVAFAGFLFLISLATPQVYEGFDLTVRGPIKSIGVQDDEHQTTEVVDQSEIAATEGNGDDEEAMPSEDAPEEDVAKDAGPMEAAVEGDDQMEVSHHA